MIDDPGVEEEVKKLNTMPILMGAFVISNSKIKKNKFVHAINGFYTNYLYYTDTDRLCVETKH